MLWTLSLIRPRWCFLPQRRGGEGPVGSAESSKLKTSLCSTGGLQTWHAGGGGAGDILTPWHQTFHLASLSLGNTSSVLQGKSLTALILAGEQSATLGFIIQATPKNCAADVATIMLPACLSKWWCDVVVGRLGLRHWTVASRGCDFISKAHHASFSCRSKATSPSVYWCTVRY